VHAVWAVTLHSRWALPVAATVTFKQPPPSALFTTACTCQQIWCSSYCLPLAVEIISAACHMPAARVQLMQCMISTCLTRQSPLQSSTSLLCAQPDVCVWHGAHAGKWDIHKDRCIRALFHKTVRHAAYHTLHLASQSLYIPHMPKSCWCCMKRHRLPAPGTT
jgi:hypothetical protein